MDESLTEKLSKIKLLAMDVDGTLTDSAMFYSAEGEVLKRFSTRDGMGITLLHKFGIQTAILTSENTEIVIQRAKKLNIQDVILGTKTKDEDIKLLGNKYHLKLDEIAYIGDDINDIPVLKIVGFSACPQDASKFVKDIVNYICKHNGGNGAIRELSEMILIAKNIDIII
ncbi:MAG TPA: HAD-IIIA family hydrolase [Candidatus Kapabacteria bacterium]|jgi:YrbI family 3-deoxy-D-manno-octulosonate 8-phosphate phosphatase|nr:HAD-IIIA family hydrolase [Candidatus Kapabacteria bacterium]HOV91647.1 HAD-IIIA family hydrolase [Candidatus Kapabacteria bacterium]